MAMVGVDDSSLQEDSPAQVGWLGLRIGNHCSTYELDELSQRLSRGEHTAP